MNTLLEKIVAIADLVDRGEYQIADRLLVQYDLMVRARAANAATPADPAWGELLEQQRALWLKCAALQSDIAERIENLASSRSAARRYLAEMAI